MTQTYNSPYNLETDYAFKLAQHFHRNQIDKANIPYIQHLIMVSAHAEKIATSMPRPDSYSSKEEFLHKVNIVSILHDLLEDTLCDEKYLRRPTKGEPTTLTLFRGVEDPLILDWIGFDNDVIEAIMILTKPKKGYNAEAYYSAVKSNLLARVVKMADIIHNTDLSRGLRNGAPKLKDIARTQQYLKYLQFLLED